MTQVLLSAAQLGQLVTMATASTTHQSPQPAKSPKDVVQLQTSLHGKLMGNLWETCGKLVENLCGKLMGNVHVYIMSVKAGRILQHHSEEVKFKCLQQKKLAACDLCSLHIGHCRCKF